jgi:hypothetical protein
MGRVLSGLMLMLLAVACGSREREGPPADTGKAATPAPPAGRRLTDGERAAMLSVLGGGQGEPHTVWFAVTPSDTEAVAFKDALEAVFKQAGWTSETQPVTRMVLKPGLSILIAAEEPPAYVTRAQQALQATSYDFKAGLGYGPYYAERKKADPKWPGIPLAAGQDFVVVIGPP